MPALRILADGGSNPRLDIVAVHGLNPKGVNVKQHAWDTWTRKRPGGKDRLWLRDNLPNEIPDARVMLYEYDSDIFATKHGDFVDEGNNLLDRLLGKRLGEPQRPLILIGHSLGGLLIKQALVNAHNNIHYVDIRQSVGGLVFFATPHKGSNPSSKKLGLALTAADIARNMGFRNNEMMVQVLSDGSLFASFLRESFRHQLEDYYIVSFWEQIEIDKNIVTKESATFGLAGSRETILGLSASHGNICKFDTADEDDRDRYETVASNIIWLRTEILKESKAREALQALNITETVPLRQSEFTRDIK